MKDFTFFIFFFFMNSKTNCINKTSKLRQLSTPSPSCTSCLYCRRNNLNVHIKRHNKDRRFSCPLCHNGFVMRAHLVIHLKRSHKVICSVFFIILCTCNNVKKNLSFGIDMQIQIRLLRSSLINAFTICIH